MRVPSDSLTFQGQKRAEKALLQGRAWVQFSADSSSNQLKAETDNDTFAQGT